MTESKRDEHQRLQERTDELAGEHDALGLDRKGFMMTGASSQEATGSRAGLALPRSAAGY